MAYNELLGDRIRMFLEHRRVDYIEKKMFGGLCFMVEGKMCVGIVREELMARIGIDAYDLVFEKEGVHEMNFTGRAMKGYVFVQPEAIDMEEDLAYWLQLCLDFNPFAKASKSKKKAKK